MKMSAQLVLMVAGLEIGEGLNVLRELFNLPISNDSGHYFQCEMVGFHLIIAARIYSRLKTTIFPLSVSSSMVLLASYLGQTQDCAVSRNVWVRNV